MTFEEVSAYYRASESLNQTAQKFNISKNKCRKILITTGDFESRLSSKISAMLKSGMSVSEVAKALGKSESAVNDYIPYTKGVYRSETPTPNALRIRQSRSKHESP